MGREDRYRYQDMDTPLVHRDGEEAEQVSTGLNWTGLDWTGLDWGSSKQSV